MTLPTATSTSSSGTSKLSVTPGTAAKYINIPTGYNGTASYYTIAGDADLVASNIKSGVDIFGVTGTYSGAGVNLQSKTGIAPSTSSQTITPDSGYDGLSSVQINAMPTMTLPTSASSSATSGFTSKATISRSTSDQYINIPTGYNSAGGYYKVSAVPNGSVTAPSSISGSDGTFAITTEPGPVPGQQLAKITATVSVTPNVTTAGYINSGTAGNSSISLSAPITVQAAKTVTPTESSQTAVASGTYTTGAITVAAIPSDYVGSGITSRSSSDLTASGATVTVPAGYYASQATKSVSTMTLPTSVANSATSGYSSKISAGIGRSTSDQYINIPPGYNASGAYYKINAVANGSATNSGSASGSSATVSTGTNTITLTKSVSITPSVTAGYISSGTAGNVSVALTASVTTKGAATITPGTTNQTIASGTYLTGAQTISGDSRLIAGNIKSGVTIFGVAGTYEGLDTSDATATEEDIISGETAYVDGRKITGELVMQTYYTGSGTPGASLGVNGDIYLQS